MIISPEGKATWTEQFIMKDTSIVFDITKELAQKLIGEQFPEFSHLPVSEVKQQGHDNRTFRLGPNMLIRLPTMECYALAVQKEQMYLQKFKSHLTFDIPVPLKMGKPSKRFPFHFAIYKWLEGETLNNLQLDDKELEKLSLDLSKFLRELQNIPPMNGPAPGEHNWWRGDHVSFYDKGAKEQISKLSSIIDIEKALNLWLHACKTTLHKPPVWVHGDLAVGNILLQDNKLSAIIDFGCIGLGDPACDLVIAWTFFKNQAREIFISEMALDEGTWLRAKAWALWKSTFELCQMQDKNSQEAFFHKKVIEDILV